MDFRREGFVERILNRGLLSGTQVKGAPHNGRFRRRLEGCTEQPLGLLVHFAQAAREHLSHAFFETDRSQISERLSRDSKDFLLG